MTYKDELTKAMNLLAKDNRIIFIGQNIVYPGSIMSSSLKDIDNSRKIELPLIEDAQMGMSIGLSLEGYIPVSIYPRIDFLIIAMNQLVNHLDKIKEMSCGQFKPKVIIRTAIGSTKPLYPGLQHCSDYSDAFKCILKNVDVIKLTKSKEIVPTYKIALDEKNEKSTLIIEVADLYSTK
jgi:pyruvate/2-oxoglutarate/acetoin dehydrogenase E1 component